MKKSTVIFSVVMIFLFSFSAGILLSDPLKGLAGKTAASGKTQEDMAKEGTQTSPTGTVQGVSEEEPTPAVSPAENSQGTFMAAEIVVYNTHPFEKYKSGESIATVSERFCKKLQEIGLEARMLQNTHDTFQDSYKQSRKLIFDNVAEYNSAILLDLHIGDTAQPSKKNLNLWVGKGNQDYVDNLDFANRLARELEAADGDVSCAVLQDRWVWNQDLSRKALMVMPGNSDTPIEDADRYLAMLAQALRNLK